ncbi:hypothetical protein [Aurantimonas endophytica]|uniref:Uncharacterized protein n=1 Tax=Aurantimonas endophytica TaxID=1522175 RepID=A0A7W6HAF9_9HYPH|nr:hypothetical protein [Aurantimonas endophytica]MBB4001581.1 hypothetical protein [Aurantimonas endophytica]MCO6402779.1 hypothetical protein [Aurantimonas endophytica]
MPDDRYTLRKDPDGTWRVVDIFTDLPAVVHSQVMILMDMEEADDIVDLLNTLDRKRRAEQAP